jgi:misacylated tRNA(Ala) deacylase
VAGNHRQNRPDQSRTAKTWLSRGSELTGEGVSSYPTNDSSAKVVAVEEKIHEAVEADYSIRVYTLPQEQAFAIPDLIRAKINLLPPEIEEVRIVEIVGLDLQADGGTHVNHTKEVGGIKIRNTENKGKINKRLEIRLED